MNLPKTERKYQLLTRQEYRTNEQYGKFPENRTVNELLDYGLILLNKPSGPTSHQVADTVKKILNLNKVGHSGTLE
jgi:H/ACA ribonucleoprotein complex subunit 4